LKGENHNISHVKRNRRASTHRLGLMRKGGRGENYVKKGVGFLLRRAAEESSSSCGERWFKEKKKEGAPSWNAKSTWPQKKGSGRRRGGEAIFQHTEKRFHPGK